MAPTAIENTHKNAQRVELGFAAFDADNHYYEAEDAFTRHMPREMAKRCMQWAEIDGKKRLLVGGRVNRFIPNPTFNPVSKPGALDAYFRGRVSGGDMRTLFGELDPISPAYRKRDARVALMKEQGLAGAMFFPTLAVGMEESLRGDAPAPARHRRDLVCELAGETLLDGTVGVVVHPPLVCAAVAGRADR